jgi:hypothetical protein
MLSTEPVALDGTVVPLQDYQGLPIIDAVIGGHSSRAFLETGAKLSYWSDPSLPTYPAAGLREDFYPGIGANPLIIFTTVALASGTLEFKWLGDNGYEAVNQAQITVS